MSTSIPPSAKASSIKTTNIKSFPTPTSTALSAPLLADNQPDNSNHTIVHGIHTNNNIYAAAARDLEAQSRLKISNQPLMATTQSVPSSSKQICPTTQHHSAHHSVAADALPPATSREQTLLNQHRDQIHHCPDVINQNIKSLKNVPKKAGLIVGIVTFTLSIIVTTLLVSLLNLTLATIAIVGIYILPALVLGGAVFLFARYCYSKAVLNEIKKLEISLNFFESNYTLNEPQRVDINFLLDGINYNEYNAKFFATEDNRVNFKVAINDLSLQLLMPDDRRSESDN